MKQKDIHNALMAYVNDGDTRAWENVVAAIREGQIEVESRANGLVLSLVSRPALLKLGERLQELRKASGKSQIEIAQELRISESMLHRSLNGKSLPAWPVISGIIAIMGATPSDYWDDYQAARAEQQSSHKREHPPT